jgi:hypothetical protein
MHQLTPQGFNATVLAYGQTGSGKTLTMSGGSGIYGLPEKGVTMSAHAAGCRGAHDARV